MSPKEKESKSTESVNELKVVERGEGWFKIEHHPTGNICTIMDTFAEMYDIVETSPVTFAFYRF